MSHAKPFSAAASRDVADPSLDTEEMTDELLSPEGAPMMVNSEDLFEAPTPDAAPSGEADGEDTQVDAVPVSLGAADGDEAGRDDAMVVGDDGVIGELPPPSRQDIDLPVEVIVARSGRTDDYLRKWRTTSVDRKSDWEAEQAVALELAAQRRGWFYLGAAGGVAIVLLGFCGLLATGVIGAAGVAVAQGGGASRAVAPAAPASTKVETVVLAAAPAAGPTPPEAAPERPEVAPTVALAEPVEAVPAAVPELPAPVAEAKVTREPKEPVAAPEAVAPVRAVVTRTGAGAPTVVADGTTWTEGRFRWAGALVVEDDVELAWFDAAGREVLDRVACTGRDGEAFRCLSGRSPKRIGWALDQGAEKGTWTVKACRGSDCVDLGTTVVE